MYADKQQFNPMDYGAKGAPAYVQAVGSIGGESAMRQPEVVGELDRLVKAVEILSMTAESLTNRLNPVRSQVGNLASGGQTSPPEPVLCGMASALRSTRQRLEGVQNELHRALNELEI
jgi:hypothetical protein